MAVLNYLPKLLRGLGLAFAAHFLHNFYYKNVLYLTLHLWAGFQCHTFYPSQDIKQTKCVIEFVFRQLMTS